MPAHEHCPVRNVFENFVRKLDLHVLSHGGHALDIDVDEFMTHAAELFVRVTEPRSRGHTACGDLRSKRRRVLDDTLDARIGRWVLHFVDGAEAPHPFVLPGGVVMATWDAPAAILLYFACVGVLVKAEDQKCANITGSLVTMFLGMYRDLDAARFVKYIWVPEQLVHLELWILKRVGWDLRLHGYPPLYPESPLASESKKPQPESPASVLDCL